jgi:hypothetical protein
MTPEEFAALTPERKQELLAIERERKERRKIHSQKWQAANPDKVKANRRKRYEMQKLLCNELKKQEGTNNEANQ